MCFDNDARPPLPPIRGGALDARELTLTSRDGTAVAAYAARAEQPDRCRNRDPARRARPAPVLRGARPCASPRRASTPWRSTYFGRTADSRRRGEGFEHEPHVMQLTAPRASWTTWPPRSPSSARPRAERPERLVHDRLLHRRADQLPAGGRRPRPRRRHRPLRLAGRTASHRAAGAGRRGVALRAARCWPSTAAPTRASRRRRATRSTARSTPPASSIATVVYEDAPHSFFDRKATEFAEASAGAWREMLGFMGVVGARHDDARRRAAASPVTRRSGAGRSLLRRRRPGVRRPHRPRCRGSSTTTT